MNILDMALTLPALPLPSPHQREMIIYIGIFATLTRLHRSSFICAQCLYLSPLRWWTISSWYNLFPDIQYQHIIPQFYNSWQPQMTALEQFCLQPEVEGQSKWKWNNDDNASVLMQYHTSLDGFKLKWITPKCTLKTLDLLISAETLELLIL